MEDGSAQPEDILVTDIHDARSQPIDSSEPPPVMQPMRSEARLVDPSASSALSHEIGMVSLGSSQDPKYIGPSSGHFLARLMLTSSRADDHATWPNRYIGPHLSIPTALVEAMQGPMPLPSKEQAKQLADNYFDVINVQYPILHQPTFMTLMDQVYENGTDTDRGATGSFQVFMVLALGSTVLSRRIRTRLPGESYCLSAMQHLDRINVENSIPGLQCLLLLSLFTMHSPGMRLNVWYLNYQCIAAVLDLGLQRDINTNAGISLLDQEMRTRIFWVVLTLDRMIATMMGRPIGLRDEACDLRVSTATILCCVDQCSYFPSFHKTSMTLPSRALASHQYLDIQAVWPSRFIFFAWQSSTRNSSTLRTALFVIRRVMPTRLSLISMSGSKECCNN